MDDFNRAHAAIHSAHRTRQSAITPLPASILCSRLPSPRRTALERGAAASPHFPETRTSALEWTRAEQQAATAALLPSPSTPRLRPLCRRTTDTECTWRCQPDRCCSAWAPDAAPQRAAATAAALPSARRPVVLRMPPPPLRYARSAAPRRQMPPGGVCAGRGRGAAVCWPGQR